MAVEGQLASEASGRPQGLAWLADLCWVQLPVALARFVPSIASGFTDGQYFMRWTRISGLLPLVAFVAGAVTQTRGDDIAFSSSWVTMAVLAAVGLLSVQLGFWAVAGYLVVDLYQGTPRRLFRAEPDLPEVLHWTAEPVALATEYLLLGLGVVGLPMFLLAIRLDLRRRGLAASLGPAGERLVHAASATVAYYVWSQALITSIRTVFNVPRIECSSRGGRHGSGAVAPDTRPRRQRCGASVVAGVQGN